MSVTMLTFVVVFFFHEASSSMLPPYPSFWLWCAFNPRRTSVMGVGDQEWGHRMEVKTLIPKASIPQFLLSPLAPLQKINLQCKKPILYKSLLSTQANSISKGGWRKAQEELINPTEQTQEGFLEETAPDLLCLFNKYLSTANWVVCKTIGGQIAMLRRTLSLYL